MEVVTAVMSIPGVVGELLKASKAGYDFFQDVKGVSQDVRSKLYELEVTRIRLDDWIRDLGAHGSDLAKIIDPNSRRYKLVLVTLALIAGVFAEVEQLHQKYGICEVDESKPHPRVQTKTDANTPRKRFLPLKAALGRLTLRRSVSASAPVPSSSPSRAKSPQVASSSIVSSASAIVATTLSIRLSEAPAQATGPLSDINLDEQVPGVCEYMQIMEQNAKEYQKRITTMRKLGWVFSDGKRLDSLITDLDTYITQLHSLTEDSFSSE